MTRSSVQAPFRTHALGAAMAMLVALGGTAACSSGSDAEQGSSEAPSAGASGDSPSGSDQALPDGFPDDVPLPQFTDLSTVLSGTDDGYWSIVLTIDPTLEQSGDELEAAYRSLLEDAGFETGDADAEDAEAENEQWTITYRSSMDGTLTIGTIPK